MKYEKAVAVVVEFDNSDVVTESLGDGIVDTEEEARHQSTVCKIPSVNAECSGYALDLLFPQSGW